MRKVRAKDPPTTRKCRLCGEQYLYGRKANYHGKFCSDKCRSKATHIRYTKTRMIIKCKNCNKDFKAFNRSKRKFCGRECWRKWFREIGCALAMKQRNKTLQIKPNNGEINLGVILKPYQFKYVGNGKLSVGRFNPDFVHKKLPILVELFGEYWHKPGTSRKRIAYFRRRGYDCMVIWHTTVRNDPDSIAPRVERFVSKHLQ